MIAGFLKKQSLLSFDVCLVQIYSGHRNRIGFPNLQAWSLGFLKQKVRTPVTSHPRNWYEIPHRIHVWYIYLYLPMVVATQIFFIFTPILGVSWSNLTSIIFFKWVGFNHQLEEIDMKYISLKTHTRLYIFGAFCPPSPAASQRAW